MIRLVVAGVFILGIGEAQAQLFSDSIGPKEIGPISISLHDNAADACWTNLKEVREYAEEKLRAQGYLLGEDRSAMLNYTLLVDVNAFRHQAAPTCVGMIQVNVMKGLTKGEVFGVHVIAMNSIVVTSSLDGNLNNQVIEVVQELIDGM